MDEEFLKRLAKEIARLHIRVAVLQSELRLFREVDHEYFDRKVEEVLLSEDGKLVYQATLLALKGEELE